MKNGGRECRGVFFGVILALVFAGPVHSPSARAGESKIHLRPGPGHDAVTAHCVTCHSLDYLQMNGGFLDREGWQKEVDKMIQVMGAPIPASQVPAIVGYLTRYYGKAGAVK